MRLSQVGQDQALTIFNNHPNSILIVDLSTTMCTANKKMLNLLLLETEFCKLRWNEINHIEDFINEQKQIDRLFSGSLDFYDIRKRFRKKDREYIWTNTRVMRWSDSQSKFKKLICYVQEIIPGNIGASKCFQTESELAYLMVGINGFIYRCEYNQDWTMKYISEGCYNLTGYMKEDFLDNHVLSFQTVIHPAYTEKLWEDWQQAVRNNTEFICEYEIITACGKPKWVSERGKPVFDEQHNKILYLEGIIIDITKQKEKENEIRYLSEHDYLTDLLNRRVFEDYKNSISSADEYPVSVIVADIDGLKLINDTLGHSSGDELIKRASMMLAMHKRQEDMLFRTGGDEFCLILPKTDAVEVECIMTEIMHKCSDENYNQRHCTDFIELSLGHATAISAKNSISNIILQAEDYMYRRKLIKNGSAHGRGVEQMKGMMFERSQETEEHSGRLTSITKAMGVYLNLNNSELDDLELFSTLHDIGKVGIPDSILLKKGKLTDDEFLIISRHSSIGYRIANASQDFKHIAEYILHHHERWDGSGYPQGLKGEKIPLLSRILAVADTYDAITENRVYRKARNKQFALQEIQNNSGTQFDPRIVEVFLEIMSFDSYQIALQVELV